MRNSREKKEAEVTELAEKISSCTSGVLADFRGLNVADMTELRRKLRDAGVEFKVVKNTLARLAAPKAGVQDLDQFLEGPTAIAFGTGDPVIPAKVLGEFAKKHKELEIKGGILEKKAISLEKVKMLAELPSKEELLAQVARGLQAPIARVVNVFNASLCNFVYVLDAVRRKKEELG